MLVSADSLGDPTVAGCVSSGDGKILFGYREDGRISFDKQRSEAACTIYWNGGTRLFKVDPQWLLEKEADEDFSQGLKNLQAAATAGVEVTAGPEGKLALHLSESKAHQPAGVAWNFPFSPRGSPELRLRIEPGMRAGTSPYPSTASTPRIRREERSAG